MQMTLSGFVTGDDRFTSLIETFLNWPAEIQLCIKGQETVDFTGIMGKTIEENEKQTPQNVTC